MSSKAEIFRTAASILREKGQAKGIGQDDEGRVCLVTAHTQASHTLGQGWSCIDLVNSWQQYRDSIGFDQVDPVTWNDRHATQTEVEKFFLWAADRVEFGDES